MKWEAAKLKPIQRLFRRDQRVIEELQRLSMLEAVKAIAKRIRELRPVASIACLTPITFNPTNPKWNVKKMTISDVTKVVILQPSRFIIASRKDYLAFPNRQTYKY